MIREGDRVRVLPREKSPPSQKYAGQTGIVTTTSPSVYGPLVFVQMDEVHISVNRLSGRTMYFGWGHVEGESVPFHLDAVRGPGARETTITGTLVDGALTHLEVSLGRKLEALHPTPSDDR